MYVGIAHSNQVPSCRNKKKIFIEIVIAIDLFCLSRLRVKMMCFMNYAGCELCTAREISSRITHSLLLPRWHFEARFIARQLRVIIEYAAFNI